MSFIKVTGVSDVQPEHILEEGEHLLRIVKAEDKLSQAGNPMISLMLVSVDDPDALPIFDNLMLVDESTPDNVKSIWLRRLKQFQEAAGVNFDEGFDTEDLTDKEVWTILKVEDDDVYGRRNRVARYTAGK